MTTFDFENLLEFSGKDLLNWWHYLQALEKQLNALNQTRCNGCPWYAEHPEMLRNIPYNCKNCPIRILQDRIRDLAVDLYTAVMTIEAKVMNDNSNKAYYEWKEKQNDSTATLNLEVEEE